MGYEYQTTDDLIYEAIYYDDWGRVSETFKKHPELLTKPLNRWLETPLMIAVGTNQSHDFVKNLLSSLSKDHDLILNAIVAKSDEGDTALHYACQVGNMIDAKRLVTSWSKPATEIIFLKNTHGVTPLFSATSFGRKKEMLKYFYSLGILLSPTVGPLLQSTIDVGFPDIALKLVKNSSILYLQPSLNLLAKSNLFPSGSKLGFWHRCIYDRKSSSL
ncbi:hypothetical protein OSB04_010115 [Centaurea solstitialis]|uniref:Uncharacterized protein n=1 Tax=Centaurea solstitialis TaxID=347529 RepID=A0AA38WP08_9ASTR|nr:hypothetical protein OSB04_010115 [Centaurea solstitialis]